MNDDLILIRPPSEANSFLLAVTSGCSHNKCTFCRTYRGVRFKARSLAHIKRDIDGVAQDYSWSVRKVFLENGDALACSQARLLPVLEHLNRSFPKIERVGSYATPQNLLRKSVAELKALRELKLNMVYMGVETGDEELLQEIQKGVTRAQVIEAGRKAKEAGLLLSVTIILGLGGMDKSSRHALGTAKILTEIDPDYAGALTLMLVPGVPLHEQWEKGQFSLISPFQSLQELRIIIANSDFSNCFFTANHASNYLPLRLRLPEQKEQGLKLIDEVLSQKDERLLKPEFLRAL